MSNSIEDMESSANSLIKQIARNEEFERGYANIFYEQLVDEIENFEMSLDNEHEVGVKLIAYGNAYQFYLNNIGYHNPYLIYFYGELSDGSPIQLIQHVSQINFILIKLQKLDPEKPKRKIGFGS